MANENSTKLNTNEIVKSLLGRLSKKERDIITRRFGLKDGEKETLESVGGLHNLTRERIRQIENATIKKLREVKELKEELIDLRELTNQLLVEHGGLAEKEYLFHLLNTFSPVEYQSDDYDVEKNQYDFMLSRLLHDEFEEIKDSDIFKTSYKLKSESLEHLEALARELVRGITDLKEVIKTDGAIDLITKTDIYGEHKDKLAVPSEIDVSSYWNGALFDEDSELINNNKILYSLLVAVKEIEQNKFGFWGVYSSEEIAPKTINHKIYLVLKNQGKPMHFVDIAKRINEVSFDHKTANPATVHNELILDPKYVLIGRGIYGLKEWGYKEGVVADVIRDILTESGPLSKEEIIKKVLENRMVKNTTINLALMDKDVFEKVGEKYQVKK
ncbi:MAG: sigma factor-like helix-turn-helix DNA-binding protein [Patescibacteria group bacterium]|nr:sigma factor-like helix-turn-helix DNA-binding protein [Patescibacteria group bacterium]